MVSALGLCHKGRKTKELLYGSDEERPVVLQIFGSNAEDIARGTEAALKIRNFEALQINMACPMPKVTKKGQRFKADGASRNLSRNNKSDEKQVSLPGQR
jgi:tRNA-U20-dihydrouridine synthase